MIFVDTSAWFALMVRSDPNHAVALGWMSGNREPLLTSDYVVDETLTLLRARRQPGAALTLGRQFFAESIATVHHLTAAEARAAWEVFETFSDKEVELYGLHEQGADGGTRHPARVRL